MRNIYNMHTLNNLHTNQAVRASKTLLSDFTVESDCFDGQRHSQKAFGEKREGAAIASVIKNRVLFQSSLVEQILRVLKTGFIYQIGLLCVCITYITHIIYV